MITFRNYLSIAGVSFILHTGSRGIRDSSLARLASLYMAFAFVQWRTEIVKTIPELLPKKRSLGAALLKRHELKTKASCWEVLAAVVVASNERQKLELSRNSKPFFAAGL